MQYTDVSSLFVVMSTAEFRERKEQFTYHKEMLHSLGSIRYCKAELFKDCILGTIRLPQKNEQKKVQLLFGFYLTDRKVFLIEEDTLYFSHMESEVDKLEEEISEGAGSV